MASWTAEQVLNKAALALTTFEGLITILASLLTPLDWILLQFLHPLLMVFFLLPFYSQLCQHRALGYKANHYCNIFYVIGNQLPSNDLSITIYPLLMVSCVNMCELQPLSFSPTIPSIKFSFCLISECVYINSLFKQNTSARCFHYSANPLQNIRSSGYNHLAIIPSSFTQWWKQVCISATTEVI